MAIWVDDEFSENNGITLLQLNLYTGQLKPYRSTLVVAPVVIEAQTLQLKFFTKLASGDS